MICCTSNYGIARLEVSEGKPPNKKKIKMLIEDVDGHNRIIV